jgi:hypothetical protein
MFEFNAECYGILQVHPDQASRPRYHVVDWSDTYFKKKLSVIIVFLVNDGLFEHFLMKISRLSRNKRENENIQILFWTHVNVLFRTCYRMYSYVKFKAFSFFYQKIIEIHKKGPGGFIGDKICSTIQQKSQDGDRFENGYRFSDHPIPTHMYILYRVK